MNLLLQGTDRIRYVVVQCGGRISVEGTALFRAVSVRESWF